MNYYLYDLEIITIGDPKTFNCSHKLGNGLEVKGENIYFKKGTKQFSHYVLVSLIPYIAAKQRSEDFHDWMFFESEIACPDPKCGARFSIKRMGRRVYKYEPIS